MQVICIDAAPDPFDYETGKLKEGNIYSVLFEAISRGTDGTLTPAYALVEFGDKVGFEKRRFAPLSNIDETELIKEREEYETAI